jgi:nucleotide-binding universal stress UspA family protein
VEWASIYRHIPIPTDDSEVVWVGVNHGLALAKKHGSEVTVVTALLGSQSLPINCLACCRNYFEALGYDPD